MTFSLAKTARAVPLTIALVMLAGCFDGDDDDDEVMDPIAMPSPTPSPTPTPTGFDVTPCLTQDVPGAGVTVAEAVLPDTLTLNLAAPAGFPNGRLPSDPVIDVTLAVIFLDLAANGPGTLAGLPLNPPENDVPFPDGFPFLAEAQGNPPVASTSGTSFNFRGEMVGFERVDRMGMPAISTVLIGSDTKNAYNDADPADDAAETFVPELAAQLTGLTEALADDLVDAGLTPCAVETQG